MALLMKIIAADADCELSDDDPYKTFRLYTGIVNVSFQRSTNGDSPGAWAEVLFADSPAAESIDLFGNAYVMNENGKTVASFYY